MSLTKEFGHLLISLDDILRATNNFGCTNYISEGGFGKVYKGELVHNGLETTVAVKRLDPKFGQGPTEFWKEIMMLSRYKHENLVSLLGYSDEHGEKILVYEYLPNKSLNMYLSDSNLSWIQRLNICIGAACGLEYLHNPSGTTQRLLHRDIKSSNILLDKNWNAKISDFGLSKFGPANQEYTFLISHATGTLGYCDPVYMETGFLTKESDVYSFGVVLFEVLCGRLGIEYYDGECRLLSQMAKTTYEESCLSTIVLDCLQEQISQNCLFIFSKIAYQCLRRDRNDRPQVGEIVKQLQLALKYQVESYTEKEKMLKSHTSFESDPVDSHMQGDPDQISNDFDQKDVKPLPLTVEPGDMSEKELKSYDDGSRALALLNDVDGPWDRDANTALLYWEYMNKGKYPKV